MSCDSESQKITALVLNLSWVWLFFLWAADIIDIIPL